MIVKKTSICGEHLHQREEKNMKGAVNMARTKAETLREITEDYLEKIDLNNPPDPATIQADILDAVNLQFQLENTNRCKGSSWKIPDRLEPSQISQILLKLYHIVSIAHAGLGDDEKFDQLAVYQTAGEDKGIYKSGKKLFSSMIRDFRYTISTSEIKEVLANLSENAPRTEVCSIKNYVPVENGIFDYDMKTLLPFSPEYVFTAKAQVQYNPLAKNIIIHNDDDGTDWDIESWMDDLFDDPEVTKLIWELIGATLRPNVHWNKSAWFISQTGNNGKGTLCSLMRNILGPGTCVSIPLEQFSERFGLQPLIGASAVIVDENPVDIYVDKAAKLKAAITGDVIEADRKFESPVHFVFRGMMIQCLNENPRVKDKTDSFLRRFLLVPFKKSFTGRERKYIKHDYLCRKEVLEYVLYKVLNMNYDELSYPIACREKMLEFRFNNDPVSQFAEEILPECKWDLLPLSFLYELYRAWLDRFCPNSKALNQRTFYASLKSILNHWPDWEAPETPRKVGKKMNNAEPLIAEYKLKNWYNPTYTGNDIEKICHPALPTSSVRCIQRKT